MVLSAEERDTLLGALEQNGWSWDGDFIYASHKTMWLLGSDPWQGDITDFYERMSARVERLIGQKAYYTDPLQHQRVVEDTQSLGGIESAAGCESRHLTSG